MGTPAFGPTTSIRSKPRRACDTVMLMNGDCVKHFNGCDCDLSSGSGRTQTLLCLCLLVSVLACVAVSLSLTLSAAVMHRGDEDTVAVQVARLSAASLKASVYRDVQMQTTPTPCPGFLHTLWADHVCNMDKSHLDCGGRSAEQTYVMK